MPSAFPSPRLSLGADALLDQLHAVDGVPRARFRDLELHTAFQPIASPTHRREVGYEALLRATDRTGASVPPAELFARVANDHEALALDRLACALHLASFAQAGLPECWLFINLHAGLLRGPEGDHQVLALTEQLGLSPSSVVLELIEDDIRDEGTFTAAVDELHRQGFLIAIDDFGSGYSNLDRILRATPDVVKLDLAIAARCRGSARLRHACSHLVATMHELGALVVAEGIELHTDAVAMAGAQVDFLQGWWLGRPVPQLAGVDPKANMLEVLDHIEDQRLESQSERTHRAKPHKARLVDAVQVYLETGDPQQAASVFLADPLREAERFFVLDRDGRGIGAVHSPGRGADVVHAAKFIPMRSTPGNNMSRRPYFRQAVATPGTVVVAGPYYSFLDGPGRYAVSMAIGAGRNRRVVCGSFVLPEA